jgi:pimeloyl-ACP methyl ester carboxylesterase
MKSIYRSPRARRAALEHYDRALARLDLDVASRFVPSRFGPTHLLVAGPEDAPPLLVAHGANGTAVAMATALGALASSCRCFFVDVPGEPNRSAERRIDKNGADLGRWAEEVLDALDLERVAMLGMSGGGMVVLKSAVHLGERVSHAALLVPEGFVSPSPWAFARRVLWPLLRYRLSSTADSARTLAAVLAAMPPSAIPDALVEELALMTYMRSAAPMGRPLSSEALASIEARVLVVAAGRDLVFPGEAILRRARAELRHLEDAILLPDAGHIHPEVVGRPIVERLRAFVDPAR